MIPRRFRRAKPLVDTYDFIIVGGGSAGCVLARRLVDSRAVSVLLLEAGPSDWNPLLHVPAGFTKLTGTSHTWGYETSPQSGLNNRQVWYPQARVLGGGSSINAQLYTRGNAWDYDNWAARGCDGWAYADVLPYFRRAEDNTRFADEFHGQGGPLRVSDPVPHPLTTVFARAAQQAGMTYNPDFNGAQQAGLGFYQVTNRAGRRSSAAVCYLGPVQNAEQLTLRCDAHVERIIVTGGRATGVMLNGKKITARREVILTAGAIGSPRVLMHSGIGPAQHLSEVGIKVVMDLPGVGENLHDHMDVFVVAECDGDLSFDRYKPLHMQAWAGLQYGVNRTGPLAHNICDGGGFWYADNTDEAPAPDIQFHFLPGSGLEHGLRPIRNGVTLNSAYLRPKSRGEVRLKSSDPTAKVHINPNYWNDPNDMRLSVEGFKLARRILSAPVFRDVLLGEANPGPACKTEDDIIQYAYRHAKTDYHPVGTCSMGAAEDPQAVVTPDLCLKGIEGLRVCDSSVMPFVNSSNTNAPTIMIAEKAADAILAQHALKDTP
ncbi:GMC family oxidoreductase [Tateyamaria sp.]|uniref:GMC family oxidoreductase n=1 Tax=Tateyamaria sp. TaxID=1929288 RepID=UPI003B22774E